ncbi:MAG: carboxypeptidase regulatory-like domain-containing protein [Terracidiphilus sp.]
MKYYNIKSTLPRAQRPAAWRLYLAPILVLATLLFTSTAVRAQIAGTASIQGTVTDATGAAIPNATVTLTDEATQAKHTTRTSSAGVYLFPGVHVGEYDLTAKAPGFKTYIQKHIVLEVGSSISVNPSLTVGATTQSVEVQAEGLALQTQDPTLKQVVGQHAVTEMPLNGRLMTELVTLAPAAVSAPGGDITSSKSSYQTISLSIAGGEGNTTLYELNGGDNMDYMVMSNLPYPFPDAVNEFNVETTVMGAQNGGESGGMVNVVTKSGTNQFHGDAFEFIRNNYIDATNFFSTSPDQLHLDQFGGVIGGPVIRDKFFFFAGYQRSRTTSAEANHEVYVPTADNLAGNWSVTDGPTCEASGKTVQLYDPFTGAILPNNQYPTTPSYNASALALDKYLPPPNPAIDVNNCGLTSYTIPSDQYDNQFITREDWNISPKQNAFFSVLYDGYQNPAFYNPNNIFVTVPAGVIQTAESFTLSDTYTFSPHFVNAAHITVHRRTDNRGYNSADINATTLGINVFQVVPIGLQVAEGKWNVGGGLNSLAHFNDNTLSINDDATWVIGKNQLMFGGVWVQNQLNIGNVYEGNGVFNFNGEFSGSGPKGGKVIGDQNLDFLAGAMNTFQQSKEQQNALRGPFPALYIQDVYTASPRLTLTGGLRWTPNIMPYDAKNRGLVFNQADFLANKFSTVYPNAPAGMLYYGDPGVTRRFTNNSLLDFSPNLGLTFDPTGQGKTVLRAGAEIAYNLPNVFTSQRNQQNPPFATAYTNSPTAVTGPLIFSNPWQVGTTTTNPFPQPLIPPSNVAFFPQSQYIFMPKQFLDAYTIQWTASIQQEVAQGWQMEIDYIGNTTRHDPIGISPDPAVFIPGVWGPNGTGCTGIVTSGPAAVQPGAPGTPCSKVGNEVSRFQLTMENPIQGNLIQGGGGGSTIIDDTATANYNGLVFSANHRLSNSFNLFANYTWSKCLNIADASGDLAGTGVEDPNNIHLDYGPCGASLSQVFNMSLVAMSQFHFSSRMEGLLLNNWEFAPLLVAHSGTPINVTSGEDVSLTDIGHDRPNAVPGVNPYHEVTFRKVNTEGTREYLSPAAFTQVTIPGTYGNVSRNSLVGPKYFDIDAEISRMFPIREGMSLDLRLESFNMLNHPNFNNPNAALNSASFGQVSGSSSARLFQGAIKFIF